MGVPMRHVVHQGPVIKALIRAGRAAMSERPTLAPPTPTPEIAQTVPPRPDALIDDYIRHCGGSPSWYRGVVPAHMFPQWGFPLLGQTLEAIPYDLRRVLNGGCRIEIRTPIPRGEPLHLRARLAHIDDNGSRAVLRQELITETDSAPEAVRSTLFAVVPLRRKGGGGKKANKEPKRVPLGLREIDRWKLGPRAGLEFAVLTGDFNPIHWIPPAAKAAGFRNCILHGFSTLGRSIESMNRALFAGDPRWLVQVDCQFTRPLILPARPRVFASGGRFAVGDAPGAPAYLLGTYEMENPYHA